MLKHKTTLQSSSPRIHDTCRCQGFTLTEVITVLAIIGIMATFAIPSFLNWLPNIRLKSAGRDMFSNMQKAKINAIKENKDWAIIFSSGNNTYTLCNDDGADDDWATLGDNSCVETITLSGYKSGIRFGHGNATTFVGTSFHGADAIPDHITYPNNVVRFNPRGTGTGGYVYIENEKGTALAIGTMTSGVIRYVQWRGSWQ